MLWSCFWSIVSHMTVAILPHWWSHWCFLAVRLGLSISGNPTLAELWVCLTLSAQDAGPSSLPNAQSDSCLNPYHLKSFTWDKMKCSNIFFKNNSLGPEDLAQLVECLPRGTLPSPLSGSPILCLLSPDFSISLYVYTIYNAALVLFLCSGMWLDLISYCVIYSSVSISVFSLFQLLSFMPIFISKILIPLYIKT